MTESTKLALTHQDFSDRLKNYRDLIWPLIQKSLPSIIEFPEFCALPDKYSELADFHSKMSRIYPERKGKYLRPALVMLTGEAMGVPPELLVNTAAAQQLSEEWILIHDDMEDDSVQRRGEASLHHLYSKELAVNAGDGLHVLMWTLLQHNLQIIGADKTFEVFAEFTRMLNRTVLGQTIEIKWMQENKQDLTDEDILLIMESKTGYYTIAGPMRLGAIIAGATPLQLEKIYEFGKLTGYCFQIKDDLLDLTSDFQGLKKQTGNDILEGKRTLMLAHLLRSIPAVDRRTLTDILQKNRYQKTAAEVDWVIQQMDKAGSLAYAEKIMNQFANKAQDFFTKELGFLNHQPARAYLEYLSVFLVNRDH